jgi:iron complex outermembrane receptor protein
MSIQFHRGHRRLRTTSCAFALAFALPATALAQSAIQLPPVAVNAEPDADAGAALGRTVITDQDLATKRVGTSDTAKLLSDVPGVAAQTGGGVSSLPVIHGLADDRLKLLVDGMPITSACPNHMNPALSYIDPEAVGRIEVLPGVTPVSEGGDSIGGTVKVDSAKPVFAAEGQDLLTTGRLSTNYRSTSHGISVGGDATAATQNVSARYNGSWAKAGDYHRGGDDEPVRTSKYQVENHAVNLAGRHDGDLLEVQGGWQFSPYEGFPNQRMDLTENNSKFLNSHYAGQFNWGNVDARVFWRNVQHQMNFLDYVKSTNMPMNTESTEYGYNVKAEMPLAKGDTLRIGNELQRYLLDDWWPPVPGGGMAPNDFWNISNGQRNRVGTYAEWDAKWTPQWGSLLGIRNDTVWMNTDNVNGYNTGATYANDAAAFNSKDHAKTDVNFDVTALLRYEHDKGTSFEGGYARKSRSPNLYERYTWSTGAMASSMNTWFGDGNGYVGNIDLRPEVAHTVSFGGDWHDPAKKVWGLKVTPYYTYVQDYIDADLVSNYTGNWRGYGLYRFANHDAELFGVDISGNRELLDDASLGRTVFKGSLSWVRGRNLDTGDNLYNIMPLNARLGLDHQLGGWSNGINVQVVDSKDFVSSNRKENTTPAYALLNLYTAYEWDNLMLTAGVDNVLDKRYHEPLGGADMAMRSPKSTGANVDGAGRTFLAGVTVKF